MPLPSLPRAGRLPPLVICVALAACEVEVSGLSPIGNVAFEVRELSPPRPDDAGRDPQLAVVLVPEEAVPCALRTELGIANGVVSVHILGADPLVACVGVVPLDPGIYLPPLFGTTELRIVNDGRSDRYSLTIAATEVALTPIRSTFSHARVARVWRYPARSAALHCGPAAAAAACETLRAELFAGGGFTALTFGPEAALPRGYEPLTGLTASYVRYASEGDFDVAGARLRDRLPALRTQFPGLVAYLVNWRAVRHP